MALLSAQSSSVMSHTVHDPSLDRTMDGVGDIKSTNYYGGLDQMRTREHPHQPMATFMETMELLSQPENSHVVLNLDIKPEKCVASILHSWTPSSSQRDTLLPVTLRKCSR